jgi:hypothetical protein
MALTADQHSQIAKVYEKAAADHMAPPQQREAFARKAHWFHMLARIAAKKEAATGNMDRKPSMPGASKPTCNMPDGGGKAR